MEALYLYPVLLLAGFLGSMVYIAAQDGPPKNWWAVYSPLVAGTISGNYFAHWGVQWILGSEAAASAPAAVGAFVIGGGGPWAARQLFGWWMKGKVINGGAK